MNPKGMVDPSMEFFFRLAYNFFTLKREGDFFICRRIRTNLWPKCITTEAVYA
jgi:hypothetical protein